jgi:cellulose synthase/poly-beta-1,6-N-acetylglucosamine synthase-like glycosyltransferase
VRFGQKNSPHRLKPLWSQAEPKGQKMGDMRIKYSVIIPTYNRELLLAEALRSVQAALPDCSEVIVVNDGTEFERRTCDLIETLGAVAVKTKGGLGAGATSAQTARAVNGFCFWMMMISLPSDIGRRSPTISTHIFNPQISPMGFAAPTPNPIAEKCSTPRQPRQCFIFSRKRAGL